MSTPAQIAANIENAKLSTGPKTEAGKATSSQNGTTQGLFAAGSFVRPFERAMYSQILNELLTDLQPVGILECNLVEEMRRAIWRLRRCGDVESHLAIPFDAEMPYVLDPMETSDAQAERIQRSVDRARAQAHRLLHKCTSELRRLQTDRLYAGETSPDGPDTFEPGIPDRRAVVKAHAEKARFEIYKRKADVVTMPTPPAAQPITMRTQSDHPKAA